VLLLQIDARRRDLQSKWWGTHQQFKAIGGSIDLVKEQHTDIIFFNEEGTFVQKVYNAMRSEGLPHFQPFAAPAVNYKKADKLIESINIKIEYKNIKEAYYYYPPADYIEFPLKEMFIYGSGGLPAFYETMFHELAHWTECHSGYSNEHPLPNESLRELRAEMTAGFLCSHLNVPSSITRSNHDKWLDQWISFLEWDPSLIFEISDSASNAVDHLLSFVKE